MVQKYRKYSAKSKKRHQQENIYETLKGESSAGNSLTEASGKENSRIWLLVSQGWQYRVEEKRLLALGTTLVTFTENAEGFFARAERSRRSRERPDFRQKKKKHVIARPFRWHGLDVNCQPKRCQAKNDESGRGSRNGEVSAGFARTQSDEGAVLWSRSVAHACYVNRSFLAREIVGWPARWQLETSPHPVLRPTAIYLESKIVMEDALSHRDKSSAILSLHFILNVLYICTALKFLN